MSFAKDVKNLDAATQARSLLNSEAAEQENKKKILKYATDEAADAINVCNQNTLVLLQSNETGHKSLAALAMKPGDKKGSLAELTNAVLLLPE